MKLIVLIIYMALTAKGFEVSEHSISLPMDIFSNAKKTILYNEKSDTDICCDQKVKFHKGLGILDLSFCTKEITCKSDPDFYKQITKTKCDVGLPGDVGCLKPFTDGDKDCFSIKCYCTHVGTLCPDGLDESSTCSQAPSAIVGSDDDIVFVHGKNRYENTSFPLEIKYNKYCKVDLKGSSGSRKNEAIIFKNAKIVDNRVVVKVESTMDSDCKLVIENKSCHFVCHVGSCEESCSIGDVENNDNKLECSLSCDNWKKDFWLFRSAHHEYHSGIEGHASWRSVSKTYAVLFIIDISIGYPIIRILFGVLYILSGLFIVCISYMYGFLDAGYIKSLFSNSNKCENCGVVYSGYFDFLLHADCDGNICPYCDKIIDQKDHVKNCPNRGLRIKEFMSMHREEFKRSIKEESLKRKNSWWTNEMTNKNLHKWTWSTSLFVLLILCLIAPSSAVLKMPCNQLIGATSGCHGKRPDQSLSGDTDSHAHWSTIELGMLDSIEDKHINDYFFSNAIHRLKVDHIFRKGNSHESIELVQKTCMDGVCTAAATIDWVSDIEKGNMQSFKYRLEDKHEGTLNIVIVDVEYEAPLKLRYKTSEWSFETMSHFDCLEKDCSKVCKSQETSCPLFKKSRSKDTSWAHNPAWCWSINSGCTCVEAYIVKKEASEQYSVFDVSKGKLSAILCVEQNSMYIDCAKVSGKKNHVLKNSDGSQIQISSWKENVQMPEVIIIKNPKGSTLDDGVSYIGPVCKTELCNLGEVGDLQYINPPVSCRSKDSGLYWARTDDLSAELMYSFASDPIWNINRPSSGALKIEKYIPFETYNGLKENEVSLKNGLIRVKRGSMGSFSSKFMLNNVKVYSIKGKGKITSFKVTNCMGEYLSDRGVICTFQLELTGEKIGNIMIKSNDDASFVQNDYQTVTEGKNTFRKFMYVRSKLSTYSFCATYLEEDFCTDVKYNLSEPTGNWQLLPGHHSITDNANIKHPCDTWLSYNCVHTKLLDLIKTIWSSVMWILGALLLTYILIKLMQHYDDMHNSENVVVTDKTESDLMRRVRIRGGRKWKTMI